MLGFSLGVRVSPGYIFKAEGVYAESMGIRVLLLRNHILYTSHSGLGIPVCGERAMSEHRGALGEHWRSTGRHRGSREGARNSVGAR